MAQETGLFSIRRPRETLGALNLNVSSIPLPASALKKAKSVTNFQQAPHTTNHARSVSGSRMSLAPGRPNQPVFQRSSSGTNLPDAGFSTVQRASSSNMLNSTGGRRSYAPVASTPGPQSPQRRSSVYFGRQSSSMGQAGRRSFFASAPLPAGVPRDPRPKDRIYQNQIAQELSDYMTQNNFEMDMKHSVKSINQPTQKDFLYIFQWLYNRIDPSYKFQKGIDAEAPAILKLLRYPYEKSITKSQLQAVGGQNWGTFLCMLHWMMQLARQMDQYSVGAYDDACIEANYDVTSDRVLFEFLSGAYTTWVTADDDQANGVDELIKPHVDEMAAKFNRSNSKYLEEAKILEAEHRALQDQIDELSKSRPKLAKLEEQIKILEEDKGKFENYNSSMEARCERWENKAKILEQETDRIDAELQEAEQERISLQSAVDRQGITVQDIDRMNSERERLLRNTEIVASRLDEVKNKVTERELTAGQRLDDLERMVQDYNALGYRIGIIPASADLAKGQNFELHLKVNAGADFSSSRSRKSDSPEPDRLLADATSGYQPQHLLNLDIKGAVKHNLIGLRKTISERRNTAAEEDIEKKDLLDKIREAMEDKQQEVEGLGHRLRAAEEEFEKTRDLTNTQKLAGDAQIEKLEKELAKMRTTMTETVQLMEQREMNTNIEYEQLTLRAAALREELHTEIERMLNDVIRFKVHIQKSLEDYEQFVAEEVEKECEEQEMDGQDVDVREDA